MSRRARRVVMYFTATKDVRDYKGNVVIQASELSKARRKRIERAAASIARGEMNDQTGIGFGKLS